jgi:hypothetical protein
LTGANWFTTDTAGTRVNANALSCKNGEYLAYKLPSSANKLVAHFWTGQAGMGRGIPAMTKDSNNVITDTYRHLEVFSFAQPGNAYSATNSDGVPAIVLRVPVAAAVGAKYYAGF